MFIDNATTGVITRISPTKFRAHEYEYIKDAQVPFQLAGDGDKLYSVEDQLCDVEEDDLLVPKAVQAAKGLHEAEDRVNQEEVQVEFLEYLEDNQLESGVSDKLSKLVENLKRGGTKNVLELFRKMLEQ